MLSQNLVPNPSFEEYDNCPDTTHQGSWHTPSGTEIAYDSSYYYSWVNTVKYWEGANTCTPEYYNCGYKRNKYKPRTGTACIWVGGVVNIPDKPPINRANYISTYAQVELTESLIAGEEYCVSMHVLNSHYNGYLGTFNFAIAAFGFYFSEQALYANNVIAFTVKPQVENSDLNMLTDSTWTIIGGSFIAQGGEKYLTIGVFNHSPRIKIQKLGEKARICKTTSRVDDYTQISFSYLLDDVSVTEVKEGNYCFNKNRSFTDKTIIQKNDIYILEDIYFELNESTLLPESYTELDNLLIMLISNPEYKIQILGHTDNTGNEDFNLRLSNARAKTVAEYFISKGIDKSKVSSTGYGSEFPIRNNNSEVGRKLNRRVEFKIN